MTSKAENSSLYSLIKKIFNGCYVGLLSKLFLNNLVRKCFDEDFGKEVYMKSMNKELKLVDVNSKYVCMASLSGLLRYLESNSNIILQQDLLKINYHFLENYLNISFKTTLDLELLLNKKYLKSFGTLFSLFKCQTISGFRLLRSNILQPLTNEKDLTLRYEAVNELRGKIEVQQNLKNILSNFKEFEVAICKFMLKNFENTEMKMKQILYAICTLRASFQNLPSLCEILSNKLSSELFKSLQGTVSDKVFLNILSNIEELVDTIDLNQNNNQKLLRKNDVVVMMVKPSLNNVLDVSRKTYSDTITEIYSIYDRIKAVNNDPHMKLNYSDSLGYYLVISEEYFNEQEYIYMKKVSKKVHCSTSALISLSERVREIKKDIIDISLNLCSDLITLIQRNLNYLFLLSSVIALIDILCCLSDYATNGNNLIMPKIVKMNQNNNKTSETLLVLNNSRHPVLERGFVNPYYLVPNDYFLCGQFNILLIRGANASGKTTYMKQLALCVILAQIGSFVPAEYMCFTPRNFLYTKFEHNDNQENDLSSFVREIVDIQAIFSNNSQNALILLDEPFDTTISQDATALSWTILDHFAEKFDNSFILISSHNEIHILSQYYLRVCSGVMETCIDSK
jgi:DNA mismatch repair protein MSH4